MFLIFTRAPAAVVYDHLLAYENECQSVAVTDHFGLDLLLNDHEWVIFLLYVCLCTVKLGFPQQCLL